MRTPFDPNIFISKCLPVASSPSTTTQKEAPRHQAWRAYWLGQVLTVFVAGPGAASRKRDRAAVCAPEARCRRARTPLHTSAATRRPPSSWNGAHLTSAASVRSAPDFSDRCVIAVTSSTFSPPTFKTPAHPTRRVIVGGQVGRIRMLCQRGRSSTGCAAYMPSRGSIDPSQSRCRSRLTAPWYRSASPLCKPSGYLSLADQHCDRCADNGWQDRTAVVGGIVEQKHEGRVHHAENVVDFAELPRLDELFGLEALFTVIGGVVDLPATSPRRPVQHVYMSGHDRKKSHGVQCAQQRMHTP